MASAIWNEKEQRWTLRLKKDGKVKKFTSVKKGVAGKKEVLRKAREYEEHGSTDRSKAKCGAVWDKFIQDVSMRRGEQSEAFKIYSNIGRLFILPAIENQKMNLLKKEDYQAIINHAKPQDGKTAVLSKKYLTTIRMVLTMFIKYGYENGYCEPIYGSLYIPTGHPIKGKEILQPHEIKRLFEPSKWHYHLGLCFLVVTGLRPGEMLGLQWDDIERDKFSIKRSINNSRQITECKNANAQRIIPLTPTVREILERQKEKTEHLNSKWVFCSPTGDRGSQQTLQHHLAFICKERELTPISPYSLRHTFISLIKSSAIPEAIIKDIVGHGANMDTFGVYGSHYVEGQFKQAADIIDLTFKEIKSENP